MASKKQHIIRHAGTYVFERARRSISSNRGRFCGMLPRTSGGPMRWAYRHHQSTCRAALCRRLLIINNFRATIKARISWPGVRLARSIGMTCRQESPALARLLAAEAIVEEIGRKQESLMKIFIL